jgi:phenylalanine-4-hydroxylase
MRCKALPNRLPLGLERTMRTRYKIDSYQQAYFVIDSFSSCLITAPDFAPVYQQLQGLPALEADELRPQETGMYASSD